MHLAGRGGERSCPREDQVRRGDLEAMGRHLSQSPGHRELIDEEPRVMVGAGERVEQLPGDRVSRRR